MTAEDDVMRRVLGDDRAETARDRNGLGRLPPGTGGNNQFATPRVPALFQQINRAHAAPNRREHPEFVERCAPKMRCLARAIGYFVAEHMNRIPALMVRGPAHCAPPFNATDIDQGIQSTGVALPASSTVDVITFNLKSQQHVAILKGWAFTTAWDSATPPATDPYSSLQVSLVINQELHEVYRSVSAQISAGIMDLAGINVRVDTSTGTSDEASRTQGTEVIVRMRNLSTTDMVVSARLKGWQWVPEKSGHGFLGTKPAVG